MKQILPKLLPILSIFIIAILFRFWLIHLVPQPVIFDQDEYIWYAGKILFQRFFSSFSYRSYGYPMLIALIYKIFGINNYDAIYFIQILMDSSVAIILIPMSWMLGIKGKLGYLSAILYALNPFTSPYTGLILSEIQTIFFLVLTILVGIYVVKSPSWWRAIIFGVFLGLVAVTRNALLLWIIVPCLLVVLFVPGKLKKIAISFGIIFGILIALSYQLFVNYRDYRVINPTTVDSMFIREAYIGVLTMGKPLETSHFLPEVNEVYRLFYTERNPGHTAADRKEMNDRYLQYVINTVKANPKRYINNCFFSMWEVWQKEGLYLYRDPYQESLKSYIKAGNYVLLVMAIAGSIFLFPKKKARYGNWLYWAIIGTLVFVTFSFAPVRPENRLTIPLYPLVVLLASGAVSTVCTLSCTIWHKVAKKNHYD